MEYQNDFQDMIARYNRELMRTYQRQRPSASAEAPSAPADTLAGAETEEVDFAPHHPLWQPPQEAAGTDAGAFLAPVPVAVWAPPAQEAAVSDAGTQPPAPPVLSAATAESEPQPASLEPPPQPEPDAPPATLPSPLPTPIPLEVGYLQIWVTTAREALPIAGAQVTVSSEEPGGPVVHFVGETDRSGQTVLFPLPAASRQLSLTPADQTPYTPYTIDVYADGYYRMRNVGLPMYGGVKAVLPVSLIPLPEDGQADETLIFPDEAPQNLSGREEETA